MPFVEEKGKKCSNTRRQCYRLELWLPTKMQRFWLVKNSACHGTLLSWTGQFLTFCHHSFPLITHSNTIQFMSLLLNSVFNSCIIFWFCFLLLQIAYRRRRRRRSLLVFKLSVFRICKWMVFVSSDGDDRPRWNYMW